MRKTLLLSGLIIATMLLCCYALAAADTIGKKNVNPTTIEKTAASEGGVTIQSTIDPQPQPTRCHGACCLADGSCLDGLTPAECDLEGGIHMGGGSVCAYVDCPQPEPCPYDDRDFEDGNDACPPDPNCTVACDDTLCGEVIPEGCPPRDWDYYEFIIPEGVCYELVINVFGNDTPGYWPFGQGLDPQVRVHNGQCEEIYFDDDGGEGLDSHLETDCLSPGTYYISVKGWSSSSGPYILALHCVECEDCCEEIIDYCENPIIVPGVLRYTNTANTCCAENTVPCVWAAFCGGVFCFSSGPSVIYQITLGEDAVLDTLGIIGDDDVQMMVFTDCEDPLGSCVATRDFNLSNHELIEDLPLGEGTYYISTSYYDSPCGMDCGNITILIVSDKHLPVELSSFEAIAGDRRVTLNWTTASEQNNDYFELQRRTLTNDWTTIAQVDGAGNSQTAMNYSHIDRAVINGTAYTYRLLSRDVNGTVNEYGDTGTTEASPEAPMPMEYALDQNFPNPFNPQTNISYSLMEAGFVTLKVYNIMGQEIATLVEKDMQAGHYSIAFVANGLPSGVYMYRLQVNDFSANRKMLLLK